MNPYGNPITTLNEWNAQLAGGCGCCEMPECPAPTIKGQNAQTTFCGVSLPVHPNVDDEERCAVYKTVSYQKTHTWDYDYGTLPDAPPGAKNSYIGSDVAEYTEHHGREDGSCTIVDWTKQNVVNTENIYLSTNFGAYSHTEKTTEAYTTTQSRNVDVFTVGSITTQRYAFASGIPDEDPIIETDLSIPPSALPFVVDSTFERSSDLVFEKTDPPYLNESEEGVDPPWTESGTYAYRAVYSNPVSGSDALVDVDFPEDESNTASSFYAELACGSARKFRFRFKVDTSFAGNWFEFIYDIIEEPDGWDAMIDDPENPEGPQIPDPTAPERTFAQEDETVIWEVAPGEIPLVDDPNVEPPDPLPVGWEHPQVRDPDSDLWFTDWVIVQPPDTVGVRRVVNIRYRCYRGPFGSLPQLLGEQVVLD